MELLQEQKQALVDVLLIGKLHYDLVKDLLDGHGSVALLPHGRAKLIKMSGEDIVPFHHFHKFLANTTRKLRDLHQHETVLTSGPFKTKALRLVLEKFLEAG
jgi:hypothetical protein